MTVSGDFNCRKKAAEAKGTTLDIGATFIAPYANHFWSVQKDMLEESEALSRRWFARRRATAQNAMEAAGTFGQAPMTPGWVLAVWGERQASSLAQMTEDLNDWLGFCRHCASVIASNEIEAEEEILEAASPSTDLQESVESVPV